MGKKNKSKKGRGIEKTLQKTQHKIEKKMIKMEKEAGEPVIEKLIEEFRIKQSNIVSVVSTPCGPPSPRSHFSLTSTHDSNELVLFGGEYFDGKKVTMYSDLFIFDCKEKQWHHIQSPNTPPPRSSHQAVYVKSSNVPASIWIFGGEYVSPSQVRFYHYKDLWLLRVRTRKWEHIQYEGTSGPCARSGHKMIAWKNSLLLFGGFSDTGSQTVYYNDLWSFDLTSLCWTKMSIDGDVPSPRSSCLFLPSSDLKTVHVFGGYRKERATRDVERGVALSDYFQLTFAKNTSTVKSRCLRTSGNPPKPPRSGLSCVLFSANRALVFGGVCDTESDESVVGQFHNDLFTFELDKGKWHVFRFTTGNDEMNAKPLKPPIAGEPYANAFSSACRISELGSPNVVAPVPLHSVSPHPRSHAALALLGSMLYLYGGLFEVGDRKITLDDFHCLDLNKPCSWECIYPGTQAEQEWFGSDSDDDEEDTDEDQDASGDDSDTCMEVDPDGDSDDSESSDDEIVEEAPIPQSLESGAAYWKRTADFWSALVTRGLGEPDSNPGPSDSKSSLRILARRLADDFYQKHSKA